MSGIRAVAKVAVGWSVKPASVGTGSSDFATSSIVVLPIRDSTCAGPVKSSWVMSGNSTKAGYGHTGSERMPGDQLRLRFLVVPTVSRSHAVDATSEQRASGIARTR